MALGAADFGESRATDEEPRARVRRAVRTSLDIWWQFFGGIEKQA